MRYLLSRVALTMLLIVQGASTYAAETLATAVVDALHASLIDAMKEGGGSPFDTRSDRLKPVVDESFDMVLIARVSMGRHWAKMDDDQRRQVIEALRRLTTATYADRFDDYSGEQFRVLSEEPAPRGMVLVKSEVSTGGGEVIRLDYLLHGTGAGWRIIDVYLKSIYSELAVRRSEYASVLKLGGLKGLLGRIEKKIASYNTSGVAR